MRANQTNITGITYQLGLSNTDSTLLRALQLPILSVQYEDNVGIVRNQVISFLEMKSYLTMLKKKATSLGKSIVCNPELFYDRKIVFTIGNNIEVSGVVQFRLDGVPFTVQRNLSGDVNIDSITGNSDANYTGVAFMTSFDLPYNPGMSFEQNYSVVTANISPFATSFRVDLINNVWSCKFSGNITGGGNGTVNIVSNQVVELEDLSTQGPYYGGSDNTDLIYFDASQNKFIPFNNGASVILATSTPILAKTVVFLRSNNTVIGTADWFAGECFFVGSMAPDLAKVRVID